MYCSQLAVRVSAHRHFVFFQNFVKSSLGRIFTKDLRFCEQLLQKIKVNTIAEEGRTWKKGSKSSPLLCNFLRQIQFLNFKIWTSQEACCLSYHFFKNKPNFITFCTDAKPVSANSLPGYLIFGCPSFVYEFYFDLAGFLWLPCWNLTRFCCQSVFAFSSAVPPTPPSLLSLTYSRLKRLSIKKGQQRIC